MDFDIDPFDIDIDLLENYLGSSEEPILKNSNEDFVPSFDCNGNFDEFHKKGFLRSKDVQEFQNHYEISDNVVLFSKTYNKHLLTEGDVLKNLVMKAR